MKAKFYRGPMHGKVMDVSPTAVALGYLRVPMKPRDPVRHLTDSGYVFMAGAPVSQEYAFYEIKFVTLAINGQTYTAPAMHPDGSIFFEYRKRK